MRTVDRLHMGARVACLAMIVGMLAVSGLVPTIHAHVPGSEAPDRGPTELAAQKSVSVGDAAPGFDVPTVDGGRVSLESLRGKLVLVDFWATWCGPCVRETPNLKATHEAFGDDPRFAMVGLSLDRDREAPATYAKKNELRWIQGFLGDWSNDKVTKAWGVRGIPAIFLVGPDGKIVAQNLRGDRIKEAVREQLAAMPEASEE